MSRTATPLRGFVLIAAAALAPAACKRDATPASTPAAAAAPAAAPTRAEARFTPLVAKARAGEAAAAPRRALVVNTQDASVSVVDIATMKETRRIRVGARPYGIAVTRDEKSIAVGVEDEEKVKFFRAADFAPEGEVHIGKMFNDHLVLSADGAHLYLADFYSDDLVAIDVAKRAVSHRFKGGSAPHVVKLGPSRKRLYATCKKVTGIAVVEPETRALKLHALNVNPRSLTFSPDETKLYFGSFWVDGFFEMETASGKVTRLFAVAPPAAAPPQEVTYHGVEAVGDHFVLAANEGRSYVDAVDVRSGAHIGRLSDVSKPCCIERIPGGGARTRVLVSNIGDATLTLVEVSAEGKLRSLGKVEVGKAPKRVAFLSGP